MNEEQTVNPARVWMAMARRGLNRKQLAEKVGEPARVVGTWVKRGGYGLHLTQAQMQRLSLATGFPPAFFLQGDEEEEFEDLNMIGRQMFGADHREVGD